MASVFPPASIRKEGNKEKRAKSFDLARGAAASGQVF